MKNSPRFDLWIREKEFVNNLTSAHHYYGLLKNSYKELVETSENIFFYDFDIERKECDLLKT